MTIAAETGVAARTVLLRLDGPLQSYGVHARFERRDTAGHPTASAVTGLIACALGRRRDEPLGALAELEIAVRIDQGASVLADYQTVGIDGWRSASGKVVVGEPKLSKRFYLQDAVFAVAVGHRDPTVIAAIDSALRRPHRPLFLGRKSCPAAAPIRIGTSGQCPADALTTLPYQGHLRRPPARLPVVVTDPDGRGETVQDVPLSFRERTYALRTVRRLTVPTPAPAPPPADVCNPYGI